MRVHGRVRPITDAPEIGSGATQVPLCCSCATPLLRCHSPALRQHSCRSPASFFPRRWPSTTPVLPSACCCCSAPAAAFPQRCARPGLVLRAKRSINLLRISATRYTPHGSHLLTGALCAPGASTQRQTSHAHCTITSRHSHRAIHTARCTPASRPRCACPGMRRGATASIDTKNFH